MKAPHVQLGSVRPDGTRGITVTDETGMILHGDVGPGPNGLDRPSRQLLPEEVAQLAAIAGRAPSVHNTQPWKFRAYGNVVELLADPDRRLGAIDPDGREMLISCGAALFGLRLGMRRLGYLATAELLPAPASPEIIGRVRAVGRAAITRHESELFEALHHRHTHRGAFAPGEVSPRLIAGLRLDAMVEHAELAVLSQPGQVAILADLVLAAAREQSANSAITAEARNWARPAGSIANDGVPAFARAQVPPQPGGQDSGTGLRLAQRDFGLPGTAPAGGPPPSVTAVLMTSADTPADWIRAGQALHRMLLHAATRWVFASLQSQPLESPALRAELRATLGLSGEPQLLLQFGRSNTAPATARRPAAETLAHDGASEF